MAKITAVIDIGSNSVRMVVFKKTSRFGFYILEESKARVRLSEHAWENNGVLQIEAMDRTKKAIVDFVKIAQGYKARKILCVATSATRDASNKAEFLRIIKESAGIDIKIIDGKKEANFGAIAALNLLPLDDGITIDIGGGSTELALIKNKKIEDSISFNLGTVRLKEIFFDKSGGIDGAREYVRSVLEDLPDAFRSDTVVGIGGTLRSLASLIMKQENYPLDVLHAYCFDYKKYENFLENILQLNEIDLKKIGVKQDRLDVIKEGVLILLEIAKIVEAKKVMTSGVGVRDGVFLHDLLRNSNGIFPHNYNPSVSSILDRFNIDKHSSSYAQSLSIKIFKVLAPIHKIDPFYLKHLSYSAKLSLIGNFVNIYYKNIHAYNIVFNGLSFGFSHEDRVLISKILKNQTKKELAKYTPTRSLVRFLPSSITVKWLSLILFLASSVNKNNSKPKVELRLVGTKLFIKTEDELYLTKESLIGIKAPNHLEIIFEN